MDNSGFLKLIREKLRVNSTDEQLVSYLRGVRNPTVWSRFDQVTSTNSLQFFSTNFPVQLTELQKSEIETAFDLAYKLDGRTFNLMNFELKMHHYGHQGKALIEQLYCDAMRSEQKQVYSGHEPKANFKDSSNYSEFQTQCNYIQRQVKQVKKTYNRDRIRLETEKGQYFVVYESENDE